MIKNIKAIFQKQIKDTYKNKVVLIQFLMLPVISIIMENSIHIEGMPEHFFAKLFAAMYVGMAPLTSMAAVISEEKEKNTLRVLLMSNVKPIEYLVGVGSYIWIACMLGACVIGIGGSYRGSALFTFLAIMSVGILASLVIGAAIGTWSRNQMMATSLTVPVMSIFSFLPMLAMFNETIEKIAKAAYTQQISILINNIDHMKVSAENAGVILSNIVIAAIFFGWAYKKCGLD